MSSATKTRAGTKATTDAVFKACDHLRDAQGEFRVEEVHALTGGGMSTVLRLVQIWRDYKALTDTTRNLSSSVTIAVAQALDHMVGERMAEVDNLIERFDSGTRSRIDELSSALADHEHQLANAMKQIEELREERNEARNRAQALSALLEEKEQQLAAAHTGLDLRQQEIANLHETYRDRMAQQESTYQTELTNRLDRLRKTLTAEHADAIATIEHRHRDVLAAAQDRADTTREDLGRKLAAADRQILDLTRLTASLEALAAAKDESLATLKERLEARLSWGRKIEEEHKAEIQRLHTQLAAQAEEYRRDISKLTGDDNRVLAILTDWIAAQETAQVSAKADDDGQP